MTEFRARAGEYEISFTADPILVPGEELRTECSVSESELDPAHKTRETLLVVMSRKAAVQIGVYDYEPKVRFQPEKFLDGVRHSVCAKYDIVALIPTTVDGCKGFISVSREMAVVSRDERTTGFSMPYYITHANWADTESRTYMLWTTLSLEEGARELIESIHISKATADEKATQEAR